MGHQGDAAASIAAMAPWLDQDVLPDVLLVLAATRTAEQEGISAAGATAAARRTTAVADAELLLKGPSVAPRCGARPFSLAVLARPAGKALRA